MWNFNNSGIGRSNNELTVKNFVVWYFIIFLRDSNFAVNTRHAKLYRPVLAIRGRPKPFQDRFNTDPPAVPGGGI